MVVWLASRQRVRECARRKLVAFTANSSGRLSPPAVSCSRS